MIAHAFGCTDCCTALVNPEVPLGSAVGFAELHELAAPFCNGVLLALVDDGAPISLRHYLRAELLDVLRARQ